MKRMVNAKKWRRLTTPFSARGGRFENIYAAVDLGTNNCRMLIAKPTRAGFRVIDSFSRIVRLGEGLHATPMLSGAAIDRTVDALLLCSEKIAEKGASRVRCVATEACRIAENRSDFTERVATETGLSIETISPSEEARLSVRGCESLIRETARSAIILDIGGGSTEVVLADVRDGKLAAIRDWVSLPCGVVTFSERFSGEQGEDVQSVYQAMVDAVRRIAEPFESLHDLTGLVKAGETQIIATSGTATTLAALHLGLRSYNRKRVDGAWIDRPSIFGLMQKLGAMTLAQRASLPCVGDSRADLIVAGCAILDGLCGPWPFRHLQVADRGLREGILLEMMERSDRAEESEASA